jgi:hypothetical protein
LSFIKPPRFCLLLFLTCLGACGQRGCVVHMSICCRRRAIAPDSPRRAIAERLMKALLVVEGEVCADAGFRLAAVGIAFQIDVLVFQRAPDTFDAHVVHPATAPVYRDAHAGHDQHAGEIRAGELVALVGVEDLRLTVSGQRLLQRRHAERRVHRVRQPPGKNRSARPVDDGDQIEKAAADRNVRDIGITDLVRPFDRKVAQEIGIDLMAGRGFAGARLLPQRLDPIRRIRRRARLRSIGKPSSVSVRAIRRAP